MPYAERDFLPISALQHLIFCERQCALIHVERLWAENRFTAEGASCTARRTRPESETRPAGRTTRAVPLRPLRTRALRRRRRRPATAGRAAHARRVQARPAQEERRRPRPALRPGALSGGDVPQPSRRRDLLRQDSGAGPVEMTQELRDVTTRATRRLHLLVREPTDAPGRSRSQVRPLLAPGPLPPSLGRSGAAASEFRRACSATIVPPNAPGAGTP